MAIKFTLDDTLKQYGFSQRTLTAVSGVRGNTIKDLREGSAKSLTVEKLDALIAALNEITGDKHDISSVMIYVDSEDGE